MAKIGTNLLRLLETWWETRRPTIRTAFPAFVAAYDHARRLATVQPTIRVRYSDGRPLADAAPLADRPVVQVTRGAGWIVTHELAKGDQVLCITCDRALDTWQPSPGAAPVDPAMRRYHASMDSVVLPGLSADGAVPKVGGAGELYLGREDGSVRLRLAKEGTIALETTAASITIKPSGDIVLTPGPAGVVKLGGEAAALAVARTTDAVAADSTWATFAGQVAGYINGLVPGSVTVPGPSVGVIGPGAPRVKA